MLAVKLTSVAEAGASWAGTTDETDMAEQLPWLEQYCLWNAAEARIDSSGMHHFAPCPNRSLLFAQESTDVPSPSFDPLQDIQDVLDLSRLVRC
jgi:hypothetical protein